VAGSSSSLVIIEIIIIVIITEETTNGPIRGTRTRVKAGCARTQQAWCIAGHRQVTTAAPSRKEIYFHTTRVSSVPNMEPFKFDVARILGSSPVLSALGVFHFVADAGKATPGMVITIDEFPYLVDQDSALPSAIQRFWDSGAGRARGTLRSSLARPRWPRWRSSQPKKSRFTAA
jgi:hypothetical protein